MLLRKIVGLENILFTSLFLTDNFVLSVAAICNKQPVDTVWNPPTLSQQPCQPL